MSELLAHLAEIEARDIHRERACSSLYAYCVYELRMSEDEAQRRCRAARLARQFPELLPMLAEASIHLTGILLIGPHLTPANHDELLARVRFRTKREIERLVAELAPAPDAPARIEPLHDGVTHFQEHTIAAVMPARRRNTWAAFVPSLAGPVRQLQHGVGAGEAPPAAHAESNAVLSDPVPPGARGPGAITSPGPVPKAPMAQKALSGPRYRIQFTVDESFLELLEEARALLLHTIRGGARAKRSYHRAGAAPSHTSFGPSCGVAPRWRLLHLY